MEYEDRTNDLETILKQTVNVNKDTLNAVAILIANDPTLGPILGPSMSSLFPYIRPADSALPSCL